VSQGGVDLDELAALEEQRDFLLRSLDDLDREHDAGDLDEDDYQVLHDDYTVRTAEVLRAIAEHRSALDGPREPRNWAKLGAWVGGVVLLAVVGGWAVAHYSGSKSTPGTPGAAPVEKCLGLTQQFVTGATGTGAKPDPIAAIKCYKAVLKTDPTNATAMAYQGWTWALLAKQLSGSVPQSDIDGFVKQASSNLEAALAANPTFPDALVFSSINAYWQGDDLRAKVYLARFDALKLPASNQMSQLVDTLLRPQLFPKKTTTTTTPAPTTAN
jgi:hypothetical protein